MNGGFVTRIKGWASQPFSMQGDLLSWTLTLILVTTVAILWTRVLKHITE